MAESKLTLYIDYGSQPSRAVLAFCFFNNISHVAKEISVMSGDHKKPEYKEVNPFEKVPAIDDDGFTLFESHAILRYLHRIHKTPDHWYPSDPKKVAKIDAYLDWHHTGLRKSISYLIWFAKIEFPNGYSYKQLNEEQVTKDFENVLNDLENIWLKDEKFIGGADEISIADLSAFNELSQFRFIDYDFSKYQKVHAWYKKISALESIKKAHENFDEIIELMKPKNVEKVVAVGEESDEEDDEIEANAYQKKKQKK